MNYFLDLNRNTPRKDTLTIAYINDCKADNPQTSTNNQNDRVAIETNKSNFCMLLRLNNHLLQIHQYFLMNFIIMNYFLSLNNRIPMYATSENPKGYIWASFQILKLLTKT